MQNTDTYVRQRLEEEVPGLSEDFIRDIFEESCNGKRLQPNTMRFLTERVREAVEKSRRMMIARAIRAFQGQIDSVAK